MGHLLGYKGVSQGLLVADHMHGYSLTHVESKSAPWPPDLIAVTWTRK